MADLFLERDAVISDCGRYRYLLRRTWDARRPRVLFVMLNPSTADSDNDDPTIRSCIRLSRALTYGSIEVVNLFAFRATEPDDLLKAPDPIGPKNDDSIERAIVRCDLHVCAWGAHPMAERRASKVRQLIRSRRPAVFCLGKTKTGAPKHPLYIKSGTPLGGLCVIIAEHHRPGHWLAKDTDYKPSCAWPEKCCVQWGSSGVVLSQLPNFVLRSLH